MDGLISRQDAIDAIMGQPPEPHYPSWYAEVIEKLPSAQRKGKWVPGKELSREFLGNTVVHIEYENFTCSSCGLTVKDLLYHVDGSSFYKFCPNCGAEMKGESDE